MASAEDFLKAASYGDIKANLLFRIKFRNLNSGATSLLHIYNAFVVHIPHLLRSWPRCLQIHLLARVCPQTVQAYIDAGKDVNALNGVSFAMVDTTVGVGMQVG